MKCEIRMKDQFGPKIFPIQTYRINIRLIRLRKNRVLGSLTLSDGEIENSGKRTGT